VKLVNNYIKDFRINVIIVKEKYVNGAVLKKMIKLIVQENVVIKTKKIDWYNTNFYCKTIYFYKL
jgi:hypothetical protein